MFSGIHSPILTALGIVSGVAFIIIQIIRVRKLLAEIDRIKRNKVTKDK